MEQPRKLLTLREAAEYLRLSWTTLYRLAHEDAVPCFKVGGQWRFDQEHLDDWIAAQTGSRPWWSRRDRPEADGPPAPGEPRGQAGFSASIEAGLVADPAVDTPLPGDEVGLHPEPGGLILVAHEEVVPDREAPSLTLRDTRLPERDGFEWVRRARADSRTARVPIAFLTGLWEAAETLDAIRRGGDEDRVKPRRLARTITGSRGTRARARSAPSTADG